MGARTTGTTVAAARTSGAVCVTGRRCRAEFSQSVPRPAATSIPASQRSTPGNARCATSSEKNFVATPSHAKASPAATATTAPPTPRVRASANGTRKAAASRPRASARVAPVSCRATRSGAAQPSPPTPAAIARTEASSRRRTVSPRAVVPIASRKTSPTARVGWTRVSGASPSPSACSPQPPASSEIPASQRGRATSRRSSEIVSPCSAGRRRASDAWSAIPALYSPDAAKAARRPRRSRVIGRSRR